VAAAAVVVVVPTMLLMVYGVMPAYLIHEARKKRRARRPGTDAPVVHSTKLEAWAEPVELP